MTSSARGFRLGPWVFGVAAVMLLGLWPLWAAQTPREKNSEPFRYDPKGHRDPFVALVREGRLVGTQPGKRVESSKPVLYGILWDPGGRSLALINDVEAKVGDTVAGYKVSEIRRDAVVLTNGGEPMVLQIAFEEPPSGSSPGTTTGGKRP